VTYATNFSVSCVERNRAICRHTRYWLKHHDSNDEIQNSVLILSTVAIEISNQHDGVLAGSIDDRYHIQSNDLFIRYHIANDNANVLLNRL
jgi:hypothetical protein